MIEWIRRIVAGFTGRHTCGRQRLSQSCGRVGGAMVTQRAGWLQEVRPRAPCALAAPMAQVIALTALTALGLSGPPFHEPFHADGRQRSTTVTQRSYQNPLHRRPQTNEIQINRIEAPVNLCWDCNVKHLPGQDS